MIQKPYQPQPGIAASLAGLPVDEVNKLLTALGLGTTQPTGGSRNIQSGLTSVGGGINKFLAPNPQNTVAGETAKGVGRGVVDVGGKALGLSGDNPLVNATEKAYNDFAKTFTQSQADADREKAAGAAGAETLGSNMIADRDAQAAEFLKSISGSNAGAMQPMVIPNQGGGANLGAVRKMLDEAKPTTEPSITQDPMLTLLQGLASGAANAGPDAGFGDVLLGAGAGGLSAQLKDKQRLRDEKIKEADKQSDYKLKRADAELSLQKMQQEIAQRGETKIHTTANGLVVEMNEKDADGKMQRVLKPFTGATMKTLGTTQKLLAGLGAKDVSILTLKKDINPGDPFSTEQALLAAADEQGALGKVFGDVIGSKAWNGIASTVQKESAGEPMEKIAERVANMRLALLVNLLHTSPERQTAIFKTLNGKDPNKPTPAENAAAKLKGKYPGE